jgi:putative transposase
LPHAQIDPISHWFRSLIKPTGYFLKVELIRSSHSVGEANYHIQLTPAYRNPVFADPAVKTLTKDYILAAARTHNITVAAIGFGTDHVHVFTAHCKNLDTAQVAKLLKGFSSRMMRKHHWDLFRDDLWGNKFWSGGYFYRTVGAVNSLTVHKYVEDSQEKHWKVGRGKQKQLVEFNANWALIPATSVVG